MTTSIHTLALSLLKAGKADSANKATFMRLTSNMDAEALDGFVKALRDDIKDSAGKSADSDHVKHALQRVSTYASIQRKAKGFEAKRAKGAGRKGSEKDKAAEAIKAATLTDLARAMAALWPQSSKAAREEATAILVPVLKK